MARGRRAIAGEAVYERVQRQVINALWNAGRTGPGEDKLPRRARRERTFWGASKAL